jgi:macrolide transport system ATP-binding/permease protein
VLNEVDLAVARGEMLAIRGASGSGKSTLLYILGCLLRQSSGSLFLDGVDATRLRGEELARLRNRSIGFVFQQFHLLPRANVLDNIVLPAHYPCELSDAASRLEELREKAAGLGKKLGLGSHLHHLPNQLSGGQQQRVAIARALMNDSRLILADEPTGNLDSKNAAQIMELLQELNKQGTTVVVVTHDEEIARKCGKARLIKDGEFVDAERRKSQPPAPAARAHAEEGSTSDRSFKLLRALLPLAWENLRRNAARSTLTMLGIVIGIASVLAMLTVGQFVKRSILASFEALGANKIVVGGYPNWRLKAADRVNAVFRSFDWEKDVVPLKRTFPDIALLSPAMNAWISSVDYGGRAMTDNPRLKGVGPEYFAINNRELLAGHLISQFHVDTRGPVCVIGFKIAQDLFEQTPPVGQVLYIAGNNDAKFACRVIGVLKSQQSKDEGHQPDKMIIIPYTYLPTIVNGWWESQMHDFVMQTRSGADVERLAKGIKAFYEQKYGKSGEFQVGIDAIAVQEMKRFLTMFAWMLASIAAISLFVGGIGITNMMLVSVSERFKEIGLRKALGATDLSIRAQFLLESTALCAVAGVAGLLLGFAGYEGIIYAVAKFVPKIQFEWVFDPIAFALSASAILAVGIASGIVPALKAENLQVVEALRSE